MFNSLGDLTTQQRAAIKARYRFLMQSYRRRCLLYSWLFYLLRLTMSVGSLTVPALLSLPSSTLAGGPTYWLTWGISLAVTTSNGILTLFKLDKRFFMLHATAERLRTETWQYIALAGRYSGHHGHGRPTHASQYVYYCSQIEKIHMKQVDEEFIKNADLDGAHPPQAPPMQQQQQQRSKGDSVMVPSPADIAPSATPRVRRRPSESTASVGTYASAPDSQETEAAGAGHAERSVPLFRSERAPVPAPSDTRITLLRDPSELPAEPNLGSGAAVSTRKV